MNERWNGSELCVLLHEMIIINGKRKTKNAYHKPNETVERQIFSLRVECCVVNRNTVIR